MLEKQNNLSKKCLKNVEKSHHLYPSR